MIEISSASDIGRVRTSNEDSYGVFSPAVYVVADGLGGHAAGEVASRMVVAAVHDMANEGQEIDTAALQSAILRANQQVLDASAGNSSYEGMGSTATVLHVDEHAGMAYYAHVGDSRLYLLRRGIFRQVSRDDRIRCHGFDPFVSCPSRCLEDRTRVFRRPFRSLS